MKNRFDGTNESLRKAYTGSTVFQYSEYSSNKVDKQVLDPNYQNSYLAGLNIIYRTLRQLTAQIILQPQANEGTYHYGNTGGNVLRMFASHLLTIESLGIVYETANTDKFVGGVYGDEDYEKAYYFGQNYEKTNIYTYQ